MKKLDKRWLILSLIVLVLAAAGTIIASSYPDGLETVAIRLGFESAEQASPVPAPMPDYSIGGSTIGGVFAGIAGTAASFALVIGLLYLRHMFKSTANKR